MLPRTHTFGGSGESTSIISRDTSFKPRKPINSAQVRDCERASRDSIILSVLGTIEQQAIGGGISFKIKEFENVREPTGNLKSLLRVEWQRFASDLIKSILCYGMAIWMPVKSQRIKGEYIPLVLDFTQYRVEFYYEKRQRAWIVYDTDPFVSGNNINSLTEPVTKARVAVVYNPFPDGGLSSPLASVINHIYSMETKMENYTIADYNQSRVPFVFTKGPKNGALNGDSRVLVPSGQLAQADIPTAVNRQNAALNSQQEKSLQKSIKRVARLKSGEIRSKKVDDATHATVSSSPWCPATNGIMLPVGASMITPPMPRMQNDYHSFVNVQMHYIARCFNIPPSMLTLDRSTHASNDHISMSLFNSTIKDLQNKISPFIEEAYSVIYGAEHVKDIRSKLKNTEEKLKRPLTPNEMRIFNNNIQMEVIFPYTPLTTLESLQSLYQNEVISHEVFARHAINTVGLNSVEILPEKDRKKERAERFLSEAPPKQEKPTASSSSSSKKSNPNAQSSSSSSTTTSSSSSNSSKPKEKEKGKESPEKKEKSAKKARKK